MEGKHSGTIPRNLVIAYFQYAIYVYNINIFDGKDFIESCKLFSFPTSNIYTVYTDVLKMIRKNYVS